MEVLAAVEFALATAGSTCLLESIEIQEDLISRVRKRGSAQIINERLTDVFWVISARDRGSQIAAISIRGASAGLSTRRGGYKY